jgi:MFS family permease
VLWISTRLAVGASWAPAAVGGVLIAAAVPTMVLGPVAGVFVDRWNRLNTMRTSDACRAVLILALLPLAWPSVSGALPRVVSVGLIYLVVAAANCFAQFFSPARFAIIGVLVEQADLAKASGRIMATSSLAAIIGPPLAAPVLFIFGVQWALVINAASFLVSYATLRAIRVPAEPTPRPGERAGFVAEFREGLRFFAATPVLVALTIGIVIATLGSGAFNALNVFFVTHNLHTAAKWYGTLQGAEGVGGVIGALLAGWVLSKVGSSRAVWGGMIVAGLFAIAYSRMTVLVAAILVMAGIGLAITVVNTALTPLTLSVTPQEMIGRVMAVVSPVQQVAAILSMAVSGFLASSVLRSFHQVIAGVTFGTYDTIFLVVGVVFIVGGLTLIRPLRESRPAQPDALAGAEQPARET